MGLLAVVVLIGCLLLFVAYPRLSQQGIDYLADCLELLIQATLEGVGKILLTVFHWVSEGQRPSAVSGFLGAFLLVVCVFSIRGLYEQVNLLLPIVFPEPPKSLAFSITVLGSAIGILLHYVGGARMVFAGVLLSTLVILLGALGFLSNDTALGLGGGSFDSPESMISFLIPVLLSLMEVLVVTGILSFLSPGGVGYLWFLVLSPLAFLFGIAWVLDRIRFTKFMKSVAQIVSNMCEQSSGVVERFSDWNHFRRVRQAQVFLESKDLREDFERQRHKEHVDNSLNRFVELMHKQYQKSAVRVTKIMGRYDARTTRSVLRIVKRLAVQSAKKSGREVAQIVSDIINTMRQILNRKFRDSDYQ